MAETSPCPSVSSVHSDTCATDRDRKEQPTAELQGHITEQEKQQEQEGRVPQQEKSPNIRDWRSGALSVESIDMIRSTRPENEYGSSKDGGDGNTNYNRTERSDGSHDDGRERNCNNVSTNSATTSAGPATLGHYIPAQTSRTDVGWGVVHLYRDVKESVGLGGQEASHTQNDYNGKTKSEDRTDTFDETDCTTLCILAVPSYMTSSDLLGFVGERTREDVSHFRLIRTARANKYMVLMKFRDAARAREWQREWNGKLFNSMEVRNLDIVLVSPEITCTIRKGRNDGNSYQLQYNLANVDYIHSQSIAMSSLSNRYSSAPLHRQPSQGVFQKRKMTHSHVLPQLLQVRLRAQAHQSLSR